MIPQVGDKVLVNPVFLRQYGICKADAADLLYPYVRGAPIALRGRVLTVTRVLATNPNPSQALFWVELAEFMKGIWLDPTGRYAGCRHCCQDGCSLSKREPFFVLSVAEVVEMTSDQIKRANTKSGVGFCAACGGPLKDPGMGPTYKHCPRCEP